MLLGFCARELSLSVNPGRDSKGKLQSCGPPLFPEGGHNGCETHGTYVAKRGCRKFSYVEVEQSVLEEWSLTTQMHGRTTDTDLVASSECHVLEAWMPWARSNEMFDLLPDDPWKLDAIVYRFTTHAVPGDTIYSRIRVIEIEWVCEMFDSQIIDSIKGSWLGSPFGRPARQSPLFVCVIINV